MKEILVPIFSAFLIVLGGIGSILPILPGTPLSFGGLFLYAWFTNYEKITPLVLIIFGILTVLTMVIDFVAPAIGAKGHKATLQGVIGSILGGLFGVFVLGPLGIIIGPLVGSFVGEYMAARNLDQATKVAIGSFAGLLIGSFVKIGVVMAMLIYLVYALF